MPDILIRGLSKQTVDRLKARAKRHGRSFQGEVRQILQSATTTADVASALKELRQLRESIGQALVSDSTELIREDRAR